VESTSSFNQVTPLFLARVVGIIGLLGIAAGAFDIGYVQSRLLAPGDISVTLHNFQAHETLFRLGFSSHLFELVLNVCGEIFGFFLLRRVNGILATLALCCGITGVSIEAVDLLVAYVPWLLATHGAAVRPEQTQMLWWFCEQLQQAGLLLSWVFYGVDEFATGLLLYRSGFVPRIIGVLLGVAGLSYFTHGVLSFLSPSLDAHISPLIPVLCLPGEGASSLWLAIKGVNATKWYEWSSNYHER
jgi:hypothetical protein